MNKPRTLIIGLDGATFDLIEPWVQRSPGRQVDRLVDQLVRSRISEKLFLLPQISGAC